MERACNVLFLCTGNSARSIIAEALLNHLGEARFRAFSAGSFPKGEVHPEAIRVLESAGVPTAGLRSKSWDEFAHDGAPEIEFVLTVCDDAAGEICPIWPGHPLTAHWGVEDPSAVEGSSMREAFENTTDFLLARVNLFLALPINELNQMSVQRRLQLIGEKSKGSTFRPIMRQRKAPF